MNKPLIIEAELLKQLVALPLAQKEACWEAIQAVPETFGRMHTHSGLSIRKIRPHLFECRAGLNLRLLFTDEADGVHLAFVGTHDQIQKELRTGKYG